MGYPLGLCLCPSCVLYNTVLPVVFAVFTIQKQLFPVCQSGPSIGLGLRNAATSFFFLAGFILSYFSDFVVEDECLLFLAFKN